MPACRWQLRGHKCLEKQWEAATLGRFRMPVWERQVPGRGPCYAGG